MDGGGRGERPREAEREVSRVSFPELLYNFVLNSTPD